MDPVMPIGAQHYFYIYFSGRGRELASALDYPDPFSLPGDEIVERVFAAGYTPDLEHVKRKPFVTTNKVSVVHRGDQTFIVSVDPDVKTIMVQEQRDEAYEQAE